MERTKSYIAEYVWIGGKNELRSKARVLTEKPMDINNVPEWNYDGSSTEQAKGNYSEIILKPRCLFACPFRGRDNYLVMCDTYLPSGEPLENNNRHYATKLFEENSDEEPWYGLEQEYFIMDYTTDFPIGFGDAVSQGQYYCSVGSQNTFCRQLVDEHMESCLYAGIKISGLNAEVAPGQWEFQVGPCVGIEAGDHLWMARYILHRLSEKYSVSINFHPKPLKGDWNGSGCHTNFSTKKMRTGNEIMSGYDYIIEAIEKLSKKHKEHMDVYGIDNHLRMTGKYETSSYDDFSYGVGNRCASIRIPTLTFKNKQGYFEDRRPSSNSDPYEVTATIFETIIS